MLGWLLLAVTVPIGFLYSRQLWRKIATLASYVVCLLLSDDIRDGERNRFQHWMNTRNCTQDASMMIQTSMFVLRAAEDLAKNNTVASTSAPVPQIRRQPDCQN